MNFQGAFGYTGTATNRREVATSGSIDEADIMAMIGLLDADNWFRPNTRLMMHQSVLLDIWQLRSSGTPILAIDPTNRRLFAPLGLPYDLNNGLQALGTADNKVMGFGDFARYGVYYAQGLRASTDYEAISDQYLLTWHQWTDGSPLDSNSFRFMEDK